jgi:methylphosphotriester-DNA--protein-cysteine methyltransferase
MGVEFTSSVARWSAVCQKDPAADGAFVYAVRTTKIYCRPVCKARLARRANVDFYERYQDAERDGYRACKRCRPGRGDSMPVAAATARIRSLLKQSQQPGALSSETTEALAQAARVSKWHFHRTFKELTGLTPLQYSRSQRAESSNSESPPPSTQPDADKLWDFCGLSQEALDEILTGNNDYGSHDGEDVIDWAFLTTLEPEGSSSSEGLDYTVAPLNTLPG